MNNSIYAVFSTSDNARSALGALLDHGARSEDISCIIRDHTEGWNESHTAVTTRTDGRATTEYLGDPEMTDHSDPVADAAHGITTTTPKDAASGAAKGAGIGLGLGALAALAAITIPGVGLVIGGGALAMALGGAAATAGAGAVAGGVTGYLKDQGVPADQIEQYSDSYNESAATISVNVPTGSLSGSQVEDILAKYDDAQIWGADGRIVDRRVLAGAY